jgi:site-specific DNA-cytosine methylase
MAMVEPEGNDVTQPVTRERAYGVKLVRGPFVRLQPHELACETEDELLALIPALGGPLAVDLFCGAGGLSLGLEAAGFKVVLGVDTDDEVLETHRAHHVGLTVNRDLSDDDVVEDVANLVRRLGVTLVAGGPPCQPFSKAGRSLIRDLVRTGRRTGHDGRRDLWQSFLRVVALSGPPAVLMENVPDMALDRDMLILRTMVDELENLGYSVEERVVDTFRYGVPQFRQRLILVALRDGMTFDWPDEPTGSPWTTPSVTFPRSKAVGARKAGRVDGRSTAHRSRCSSGTPEVGSTRWTVTRCSTTSRGPCGRTMRRRSPAWTQRRSTPTWTRT